MHYYEYSLLISGCVKNDEQYLYKEWRESDFGDMNEYAGQ